MSAFKIGVMSDSFRLGAREGIRKAREAGADGIQVCAVKGEISPERMDAAARAGFRQFCAGLKLEIAALCGDLGGHGFQRADENKAKIPRSKLIIGLAADVGAPVVTTHIGVVPEDRASQTYQTMRAACRELGDYAARRGVTFAIETGPERAALLDAFLRDAGSEGMGVNLDPANLVMVTADDPVAAVHTLKQWIVHTHAKDGIQHKPCDPVQVYTAFAEGGVEGLEIGTLFSEVPLGQGRVPWPEYLRALKQIGYAGFLTVERETGADPAADIAEAVKFLRQINTQ